MATLILYSLQKFFSGIQGVGLRLGHQNSNTPFFGELKYFAALRLIGG